MTNRDDIAAGAYRDGEHAKMGIIRAGGPLGRMTKLGGLNV
jgi:hypothetical protein